MSSVATRPRRNRIVLVVGLDLADTSEHLLGTVRELTHGSSEAELHVVHVVPPETFQERLGEPVMSQGLAERRRTEVAQWELERGNCRAHRRAHPGWPTHRRARASGPPGGGGRDRRRGARAPHRSATPLSPIRGRGSGGICTLLGADCSRAPSAARAGRDRQTCVTLEGALGPARKAFSRALAAT